MATRGMGPPWGRSVSVPEDYFPTPTPSDTFSRAGLGIQAQSAQEAKPLHTLPHQAHRAQKLWERWGAGSSGALSAPSALVPPLPHSSALPAAGLAGSSCLPRGLAAAQQAPPEPQPHSLTPGPRERQNHQRLRAKTPNRGPSEAQGGEPHTLLFLTMACGPK